MGGWTDWALKNQRELAQDEPLNWVMQIATHNSYNTYADFHSVLDFPNQIYSTTDQLRAGARVILFDNYWINGAARLCHSATPDVAGPAPFEPVSGVLANVHDLCFHQIGFDLFNTSVLTAEFSLILASSVHPSWRYYSNGIEEIRNWLQNNPNEIVIIDFEEYIPYMGGPDEAISEPIRAYLGDMVFTPPPPVPPASVTGSIDSASFIGSISTGVLTVTAIGSGTLHVGDQINGASIPPGTVIQSFGTGTGGTGTYSLNQASLTGVSSETVTMTVLTVTAVDVGSGALHVDEQITDTSGLIPPDTFIQSFGTGTGGTGTYNLYKASVTGFIETVGITPGLNVTAVTSGVLYKGEQITGAGIPDGTVIQSFGTGTGGGIGNYELSPVPPTATPSETITTTLTVPSEKITTTAAFSGRFPDRWPTKREMLAAGKRVIILDNAYETPGGFNNSGTDFRFASKTPPQPSEFLFSEVETIAGRYGDGTWFAKNRRIYPDCFRDPAHLSDFDKAFHKALFTKTTIIVEERELDTLPNDLAFSQLNSAWKDVPIPTRTFGRLSDRGIVDATECNYGLLVLDRYSQLLTTPDGTDPPFPDPYTGIPPVFIPDFHRQALAVWSWKSGDRGQNGDCAMLEGSSQRWISASCASTARFACAKPRSESGEDPLKWQDPVGNDWRVTSASGSWDAGPLACQMEFGSDGFVFSAPRNGYQNRILKDVAAAAGTATDNIWLNYHQQNLDDKWVTGGGGSSTPPVAKAGPNQVAECGSSVKLDASGSYSRDGGTLAYKWQGPFGILTTPIVILNTPRDLPLGVDPIGLTVTDSGGGTATDSLTVTVKDTTPPSLTVSLSTGSAPRHSRFVPVTATIAAKDSCDSEPPRIQLVSITLVPEKDHDKDHDKDHGKDHEKDHDKDHDKDHGKDHEKDHDRIVTYFLDAQFGTDDRTFELARGEHDRRYMVTYSATDLSGNLTQRSAQVVVEEAHEDHDREDHDRRDGGQ
jgi:hypothetical protein